MIQLIAWRRDEKNISNQINTFKGNPLKLDEFHKKNRFTISVTIAFA